MEQIIIIALRGLLLLAILWFFHGPYRQYRLDQYRQALFRLRDGLFEDAKTGMFVRACDDAKCPFDAPAYTTLRNTLNGMIQFAHELSVVRIVIMVVTHTYFLKDVGTRPEAYQREIKESRQGLSLAARKRINAVEAEMLSWTATYIVHTSVVLSVLFVPFATIFRLVNQLSRITEFVIRRGGVRRWRVYRLLTAEANEIAKPSAAAQIILS